MNTRALLLLALAACDSETFSDPRAIALWTAEPRHIEVIYSPSEDVTGVVFTSIQTLPFPLGGLEVLIDDTYVPAAQYARPVDGPSDTVLSGVLLPGKHSPPKMRFHLQQPDRVYPITIMQRAKESSLDFSAAFTARDTAISVHVSDPFASFTLGRLRRPYALSVRDRACAQEVSETNGDAVTQTIPSPAPLSESGEYCVRLVSGRITIDHPIIAQPMLIPYPSTYTPPSLISPAVVVPVYDLEIPEVERCHTLTALLTSTITSEATALGATATLPIDESASVMGSPDCRHRADGPFDMNALADRVQGLIDVPSPPIVLLVLVTNVDLPPSEGLIEALASAAGYAANFNAKLDIAMLGTEAYASGSQFLQTQPWTFAQDPQLPTIIHTLMASVLPYRRYLHPREDVIPFFNTAPDPSWFGFKLCTANLQIAPTVTFAPYATFADPMPGYTFVYETDWQPSFAFQPLVVEADLEICAGFCDQPQAAAWRSAATCGSTP